MLKRPSRPRSSEADAAALPETRARVRRAAAAAAGPVLCLLLAWHAWQTAAWFPVGERGAPFCEADHPFHFYYARLTADSFARRHAFWAYDPTFMAGYAKTLIFPTSSTLPELVAIVCGAHDARPYRLYVAATAFLTPALLALAVRALAGRWAPALATGGLAIAWVWVSWPRVYVRWGMGAFVIASAASLWSTALLLDGLPRGRRWSIAGGTAVAALATIAHPSSALLLTLILLPGYAAVLRTLSWRKHLIAWCVPLVVLLAWSPWWLPAVVLRDTLGSTASGFVNENWTERLAELATGRFPAERAILLAGLPALAGLRALGRPIFWAFTVAAGGLFALGYLAGAIPWLGALQPGRYTQPFYALLLVAIPLGWPRLLERLAAGRPLAARWAAAAYLAACTLLGLHATARYAWFVPPHPPNDRLPAPVARIALDLAQNSNSSGRILFEDRGRVKLDHWDPYPACNPSPLMPLLAPGQYIGGPYLYTHLKSNFTQVGDGRFFSCDLEGGIDLATFERYADLYNVRWAVLWSAPLTGLAKQHPARFRRIAHHGYLQLFELARTPNWAIRGSAKVRAAVDRLEVSDAQPGADGALVLSYHWVRTLHAAVPLRPEYRADDPVPFIAVDHPPRSFVIENRLW